MLLVTKIAEGGWFYSQKTFTGTQGTPDIEVQRRVSVLIGVNELGTQSGVLAYTIDDIMGHALLLCGL